MDYTPLYAMNDGVVMVKTSINNETTGRGQRLQASRHEGQIGRNYYRQPGREIQNELYPLRTRMTGRRASVAYSI